MPEVTNGEGARFENLVATHLLKRLHYLEDSSGERFELRYIRDKEAREVDFVILKDRKPVCLIETKLNDDQPSKHLYYFGEKLKVDKRIQLVAKIDKPKSFRDKKIEVYPAAEWLSQGLDKILF